MEFLEVPQCHRAPSRQETGFLAENQQRQYFNEVELTIGIYDIEVGKDIMH